MRLTLRLLSSVVQRRPFYITTPIFYVNAAPHIGHLYTALVADAIQRFEKLTNPDCQVIFSTGTDEHGTKIQQAAAKQKIELPDYCTKISNEYKQQFKDFDIDYTDFIRTTEMQHKTAVQHFWFDQKYFQKYYQFVVPPRVVGQGGNIVQRSAQITDLLLEYNGSRFMHKRQLVDRGHIYKANYSGWYSVNDEAFIPETHLKDEIVNGEKVKVSAESGHRVEWTEETNYMFRLSAFKTHLLKWLKNDGVVRPAKFQQQLRASLERGYLPDLSVSRPASRVPWAIRVPDDEEQSIYVWLDALVNYLSVTGYPDEDAMKSRGRPWPPDVQVVGKDIIKFHGIYWPALLMALGWHPPRTILCHSHWTVDGVKMSKSLNNVVRPSKVETPACALRYLLLREATLYDDANFSETKLRNTANAELADTLGNLASRCCSASLNAGLALPVPDASPLLASVHALPDLCHSLYSEYQFHKVADEVMRSLRLANQFFELNKPWELKKNPECKKQLDSVLYVAMQTLRVCGIVLQPMIPELAAKLLDKLKIPLDERTWEHSRGSWGGRSEASRPIEPGKFVLFPRIYAEKSKKAKA